VKLKAAVVIELLYDFVIAGKVENITMKVTDLKTYF
jgi:hypothetical protein